MALIATLTSPELATILGEGRPVVALVPVGSVEPHGPHLALGTDTTISEAAIAAAVEPLDLDGITALIAPAVPYGVTDCAEGFVGAVTIPAEALSNYLRAVVLGFLQNGFAHVCLVNNHHEPAHDRAVRQALDGIEAHAASVACPLRRRWARTLSDEFKSGACHAGQYETAIVMAADASGVREGIRQTLAENPVSLSDALQKGITTFREMGLPDAYAGAPQQATIAEGQDLIGRLAEMVRVTVREALTQET